MYILEALILPFIVASTENSIIEKLKSKMSYRIYK